MKHVVYWKLPGTAAAEEGAKTSPEFKVMMMTMIDDDNDDDDDNNDAECAGEHHGVRQPRDAGEGLDLPGECRHV